MCAEFGVWGDESRVGGERVVARPGPPSVPQHVHGVSGGRAHARPSHQEGPPRSAQDGRQLSQVGPLLSIQSIKLISLPVIAFISFPVMPFSVD